MDITDKLASLKGEEKRTELAFRFKNAVIFLRTTGKPGPERWMAHSCCSESHRDSQHGLQRLGDQASGAGGIKPEIGAADVPKPGFESVLLFSFFSKVKFAEHFFFFFIENGTFI